MFLTVKRVYGHYVPGSEYHYDKWHIIFSLIFYIIGNVPNNKTIWEEIQNISTVTYGCE